MSARGDAVIEVSGLRKSFGSTVAVAGIDFLIHAGELFGFLGPNGAGKTTTVRMLTGILRPDAGAAKLQGHDIDTEPVLSRAHLAVVPEEANVYRDLTVWQNIMLMAQLYGIPRERRLRHAEGILDQLQLSDRKRAKARTLSKGLRQRLMLCTALVTEPDILFLDEPTSGLDVQSTRLIRTIVRELNEKGLTVFLTTHNMSEAEEMCSRVAIINAGRIVAVDTPQRLRSAIKSGQHVVLHTKGGGIDIEDLEQLEAVSGVSSAGPAVRLYTENPDEVIRQIAALTQARGVQIEHICTRRASLEDVFLYFTTAAEKGT